MKKFNSAKDVERMLEFNFAIKKEKLKRKIRNGLVKTGEWVYRNKEMVIFFTPIVIGSATTLVKVVGKHINLSKEKEVKDLYCYDRSLGHYWSLRRELSNSEWVEIDKRKANGERLADILSELKVLK